MWVGGAILLTLLLAFLLHGIVQTYLAAPVARVLARLQLQYLSLAQANLWMVFITLVALATVASLLRPISALPWPWEDEILHPKTRLNALMTLVGRSRNAYYRHRLNETVADLALEILAERHGLSPQQVKTLILQDRLSLPAPLGDYLRAGLQRNDRASLASNQPAVAQPSSSLEHLDPRLHQMLDYLEHEKWMEESHADQ
jgi:hypothetical protein